MLPELRDARRVLAVRLDNVGDVVLAGPALRALAAALPQAEITLLASRAGAQVAPMLPWVRDVVVTRPVWQDVSGAVAFDPERELAFARSLAQRRFDAAFVFTSFNQSPDVPGYVAYLAGIPIRVGHAALFSGGVFSRPVTPPPDSTHAVDRNLALLEAVGVPVADRSLELQLPDAARTGAAAALVEAGLEPAEPYVLAAPGASCPARRYLPERFGRAVARIAGESGLPVVLAGHEREQALAAVVLDAARDAAPRAAGRIASVVGRTDVPSLAALAAGAALVIANDSGPMHLADAFARPQLVLFSGTDLESQWRPRSSPATLLRRPTGCSPCHRFDCPYALECLDIPPDEVAAEALRLLAGTASAPSDNHSFATSAGNTASLQAPIRA